MWTVVGGQGRSKVGRWCQGHREAEDWARQLIKAGITPVKINGVPFEPASDGIAEPET
jgi:hypothetical protein